MTFEEIAQKVCEVVDHFMKQANLPGPSYNRAFLTVAWVHEEVLHVHGELVGNGNEYYLNRTRSMEKLLKMLNWERMNDYQHRTMSFGHPKGHFYISLGVYDIGDTGAIIEIASEILESQLDSLQ